MNADLAQRFLEALYDEWRAGTSEADASDAGRLAGIFRDAGWANAVTRAQGGKIHDWCGFFAGAGLVRTGMPHAHRNAFWHCANIEDFATYGEPRLRNPKRLKQYVRLTPDAPWIPVEQWHDEAGQRRVWLDEATLRTGPAADMDIRPGDIVLLDYQGSADRADDEHSDEADHVTVCAEFRNGVLEVMNGNASGLDIHGNRVTDAVARTIHDLNVTATRKRIYGVARLSDLDFVQADFR